MSDYACCTTIGVIGAGFSGAMTAAHLSRLGSRRGIRIVLVERDRNVGHGVAYGAASHALLLNVPAGNMSAFPDRPLDFVNWAKHRDPTVTEGAFVPRAWYGDYLQEIVHDHARRYGLDIIHGEAVDSHVDAGQPTVRLRDGRTIPVDRLVITGANFSPANPPFISEKLHESHRYLPDPWASNRISEISLKDSVLLIGTGLTAIDVLLQLREQGHQGVIHAVSRRGLVPQAHRPSGHQRKASTPWELLEAPRTTLSMLRAFRASVRRMQSLGFDWRDVIASIRPITSALWESLDTIERARFLRHVRAFWEVHRHRVAPEAAKAVEAQRRSGQFLTCAARITHTEPLGSTTRITLRRRDNQSEVVLHAAWIINCTGPDSDLRGVRDPLWRSLLQRGLVQQDELRLGALTTREGAMLDGAGVPSDWLFLVGPLRRAQLWETTAVPELRVQALELADYLLNPESSHSKNNKLPSRSRSAARSRRLGLTSEVKSQS